MSHAYYLLLVRCTAPLRFNRIVCNPFKKQHEDLLDFMSSTFRTPAGGVVVQWDSYEEFWECLPNIPDAAKSLVTDALPTLTELVDLAKDKNFASTLKEAGVGTIPATRIASFIQKSIYDAK